MKSAIKPIDVARGIADQFASVVIEESWIGWGGIEDARSHVFGMVIQHLQDLGFRNTNRWEHWHDLGYAVCPSGTLILATEITVVDGRPTYTDTVEFGFEPDESDSAIVLSHDIE